MKIGLSGRCYVMLEPGVQDGTTPRPDRTVYKGPGYRIYWDNATAKQAQHILSELRYFGEGTAGWDQHYHASIRACARAADRLADQIERETAVSAGTIATHTLHLKEAL